MKKKLVIFVLGISLTGALNAQEKPDPCNTEKHKEFDFWVGNWRVESTSNGNFAGENVIEKIQGGCVIRETWTSVSPGYTGTSYNFYDPSEGVWNQLWLDNSGGILRLKGVRTGNQMILESEGESSDRITWTENEDGTVRQLWEQSTGDGNWTVLFDGTYEKMDKK